MGTPTPTRSRAIDSPDGLPASSGYRRYWSRNLKLIAVLLTIWTFVTFGIGFFARELDFRMLGWPFSFWVGAQGALIVYVVLVAWYARAMNRLDLSWDHRQVVAPGEPRTIAASNSK